MMNHEETRIGRRFGSCTEILNQTLRMPGTMPTLAISTSVRWKFAENIAGPRAIGGGGLDVISHTTHFIGSRAVTENVGFELAPFLLLSCSFLPFATWEAHLCLIRTLLHKMLL